MERAVAVGRDTRVCSTDVVEHSVVVSVFAVRRDVEDSDPNTVGWRGEHQSFLEWLGIDAIDASGHLPGAPQLEEHEPVFAEVAIDPVRRTVGGNDRSPVSIVTRDDATNAGWLHIAHDGLPLLRDRAGAWSSSPDQYGESTLAREARSPDGRYQPG
jgi:hypothetical protein